MASQKIHYIFPMEYKICTDKLPAVATVHSQEQSDLYMLSTTVKGLTCSNYKVKVNMNIVYVADGLIKLEAIILHNTHHLMVPYIT